MNNAEHYHNSNMLQKRDALLCLQEFGTKIKWRRSGARIIDIGCGDGSVTVDVLMKFVPADYKRLVACDISEEMIRFSRDKYSGDNIEFQVLDLEGHLPDTMRNSFDRAVSFYVLNWVKRQEQAFTNIFELLAEDGGCWLMLMGCAELYEVWRRLAGTDRWRHWLRDVERYVSPYHDSQEPEKEIQQIMTKVGFTAVEVVTKPMTFAYENVQLFKDALSAVTPFNIPKDIFNDYLDDAVDILRKANEDNNRGQNNETLYYNVLIVIANK